MGKKTLGVKRAKDGLSTRSKVEFLILNEHPIGEKAVKQIKEKTNHLPKTAIKTAETQHRCISCLYWIGLVEFLANDHACDECVDKKNPIGKHTGDALLCAKILINFQRCDVPLPVHINMDHEFHVRDNK